MVVVGILYISCDIWSPTYGNNMPTGPQPLRGYPIYEDGSYGPRFLGTYEPFASNYDYPGAPGTSGDASTDSDNMYGYGGRTPITPTPEYRHGVPGDGPQRAWFRHSGGTTTMYLTAEDYAYYSNGTALAEEGDDIACAGGYSPNRVYVPVFGDTGPVAHEDFWTDFINTYERVTEGHALQKEHTQTYQPYLPAIDAREYRPGREAWTEIVTEKYCYTSQEVVRKTRLVREKTWVILPNGTPAFVDHTRQQWYYTREPVRTCVDTKRVVHHVYQPPQQAHPGRKEQLATTLYDYKLGWNAGAQSIAARYYGCYAEFTMPLVTGVVIGLTSSPTSADVDYTTIGHALAFTGGAFRVMERGSEITDEIPYDPGDRFRISRAEGVVQYVRNGVLVYTSARASPPNHAVRLDAAMFSGGDVILSPEFKAGAAEPPIEPTSDGRAETRAPMAYGFAPGAGSWGRAEVRAKSSGSGGQYIPPTRYSSGVAMPYPPIASGYSLTGGVGSGGALVPPPAARGAAYSYGIGRAEGAVPEAYGYAETTPTARLPKFKASGRLTVYQPSRRPIRLPAVRAGGRMGAVAKAKLPKIKAGGALTVTTVMRAELTLPAFGVAFQMSVGPAGQAKLRLPAIRASGAMGAVAKASLPPLRARGAMTVGAAGEARLRLPRIRAKGTLTIGAVLSGTVVLPAIRTARSGMVLRIRLPAMRMVHRAAASGMAAGEAYSTNLRTDIEGGGNEMTRLTNFPFLRVLKFNDWYYGLAADGLYRIEGDRDDGSPIRWEVSTGTTDFGARELKHVPSVYVGGRLGPGAAFTVHEGEKRDASYRYSTPRGQAAQNYRQHFGKGLRARYYSFTLTGESEFELDGLHFELAASKRRL